MRVAARLVAAVVLAVTLAGCGSDDPAPRASDEPTTSSAGGTSEPPPTTEDEPEAPVAPEGTFTGWYLPPDGWEMVRLSADPIEGTVGGTCPCTYWAAAPPGVSTVPLAVSETGVEDLPVWLAESGHQPVDVGGRPGWRSPPTAGTGATAILVPAEDHLVTASASQDDIDVALAVADAWLDQREDGGEVDPARLPLPDGWVRSDLATREAVDHHRLLAVRAREQATGRTIEYQLAATGFNRRWLRSPSVASAGNGGLHFVYPVAPRLLYRFAPDQGTPGMPTRAVVARIGGPVDIVVGDDYYISDDPPDILSEVELAGFLDGLRPVGTEEWRSALGAMGRPVDYLALGGATIFDPPLVEP